MVKINEVAEAAGVSISTVSYALSGKRTISAETRRRITQRFPDWKQANMTARGVELLNIRVAVGSWTAPQAQEAAELGAAWDWIKTVRAASDAIEALAPIPADFASDTRWPES